MATESQHYPIYHAIPREEVLDEIQKADKGWTWRVTYFCTVCASYTFARSGSERRIAQMCPACFNACTVRVIANRRLIDRVTKEEWTEMMRQIEDKMGDIIHIVRETVAKSRYDKTRKAVDHATKEAGQ